MNRQLHALLLNSLTVAASLVVGMNCDLCQAQFEPGNGSGTTGGSESRPQVEQPAARVADASANSAETNSKTADLKPVSPEISEIFNRSNETATVPENMESFEPGQTLAIVGGHPVFVSDMAMEVNQILERFMTGAPKHIIDEQRPLLIRKLLPKYVDQKRMYVDVIANLPKEANLESIFSTAGEQFDEHVLPVLMEQAKAQSAAEMDAILRSQGSSLRLMRKSWTENELTKFMTREKVKVDQEVSRQELLDYYRENQSLYEIQAQARWEEIMVRFKSFPDRMSAKKALADMGNRIVNGANFAAVARKDSQNINASEGGKYDWTRKGSLAATELDEAIFNLPLNRLSEIIETRSGYHIIRVLERQDAGFKDFGEAQSDIREKLQEKKNEDAFQEHLKKLRNSIPVEYLIDQE